MKKKIIIIVGFITLFFTYFLIYHLIDKTHVKNIVGRYYLEDIKMSGEYTSLYYKVDDDLSQGIIREKVYAAGFNDKFIIVKQHPILNRKIVNYYIVKNYKEQK